MIELFNYTKHNIKKYAHKYINISETDFKVQNRHYKTIDYLMYPILKILNDKGYITIYSCSGHINPNIFYSPYILLASTNKPIDFVSKPTNWNIIINKRLPNNIVFNVKKNYKLVFEFHWRLKTFNYKKAVKYMQRYLKSMYKWAKELPQKENI